MSKFYLSLALSISAALTTDPLPWLVTFVPPAGYTTLHPSIMSMLTHSKSKEHFSSHHVRPDIIYIYMIVSGTTWFQTYNCLKLIKVPDLHDCCAAACPGETCIVIHLHHPRTCLTQLMWKFIPWIIIYPRLPRHFKACNCYLLQLSSALVLLDQVHGVLDLGLPDLEGSETFLVFRILVAVLNVTGNLIMYDFEIIALCTVAKSIWTTQIFSGPML